MEAEEAAPLGRRRHRDGSILGRPGRHGERQIVVPHFLVEEVGQPQVDLRVAFVAIRRGNGQVESERLVPGENVAWFVGGHAELDRLPGGEWAGGCARRQLHGIKPDGCPLRRPGVFLGRPQVGTGQHIAGLGLGRERERITLPLGRKLHQFFDGAARNCRTTSRAGVPAKAAFMATEKVYGRPGLTAIQPTLAASGARIGRLCVCR